jgi:hypothetical protein
VAIPAESHKTRLLEEKMEIAILLIGTDYYLLNVLTAHFQYSLERRSKSQDGLRDETTCMPKITLGHSDLPSFCLLMLGMGVRLAREI